jgi:hypothetical protein
MRSLLPLLLLFGACADEKTAAGLTGENPVVRIGYKTLPIETVPDFSVSIGADGTTRFEGGNFTAVQGVHEQVLPQHVFDSLAVELGPYRAAPGEDRSLARDPEGCFMDVGNRTVTWLYEDGTSGRLTVTNCWDAETRRLDPILDSLPFRLQVATLAGYRAR